MKINKLIIDSSDSMTDLCKLGMKYSTNKSPYCSKVANMIDNPDDHAHGYTAVYDMLFSPMRYKTFNFAEIGVYYNRSMKLFREYFPNAIIHGFDHMVPHLEAAFEANLPNVYYHWIEAFDKEMIIRSMTEVKTKFDVIIDDSCHAFITQVNFIETLHNFINPGGMLIIEDIMGDSTDEMFEEAIEPFEQYYSNIYFIETKHKYQYSGVYNCDKLLVLIKK
jgi:trans-aconitate methyltransferase